MGRVAVGHQASDACTPAPVRRPAAVVERRGARLQPAWPVATDVGRSARGPGPCDQGSTGRALTRVGAGTWAAVRTGAEAAGIRPKPCSRGRGVSPRVRSPRSATGVTATGHGTPRRAWSASTTGESRQAWTWSWRAGVRRARRAVWSVTARPDACQPMGWAGVGQPPVGRARGAAVWPKAAGLAPARGGRAVPEGICASAGAIPPRGILHGRDLHGGERPRAQQPSPVVDGVTPVGLHAVAWRVGHAGGRADVAPRPRLRQLPLEPGPAGSCVGDQDQMLGLGVTRAHAWVTSGWPDANRAEAGDVRVVSGGHVSHRDGLLRPIQAAVERAQR